MKAESQENIKLMKQFANPNHKKNSVLVDLLFKKLKKMKKSKHNIIIPHATSKELFKKLTF